MINAIFRAVPGTPDEAYFATATRLRELALG